MKSFSQFNEAFDKPYKIDMVSYNDRDYKGKSKLKDGSELVVRAERETIGSDKYSWDISFTRSGNVSVTGEGDSMKIFATVIDAIQQFMKKQDPDEFSFTADKSVISGDNTKEMQSREKLYSRLIKRYMSKEYKVEEDTNKLGTSWIFKKKKPVKKRGPKKFRHKSRL